jgi:hypothetical protein
MPKKQKTIKKKNAKKPKKTKASKSKTTAKSKADPNKSIVINNNSHAQAGGGSGGGGSSMPSQMPHPIYQQQPQYQYVPPNFTDRRGEDVKLDNILKLVQQQGLKLGQMELKQEANRFDFADISYPSDSSISHYGGDASTIPSFVGSDGSVGSDQFSYNSSGVEFGKVQPDYDGSGSTIPGERKADLSNVPLLDKLPVSEDDIKIRQKKTPPREPPPAGMFIKPKNINPLEGIPDTNNVSLLGRVPSSRSSSDSMKVEDLMTEYNQLPAEQKVTYKPVADELNNTIEAANAQLGEVLDYVASKSSPNNKVYSSEDVDFEGDLLDKIPKSVVKKKPEIPIDYYQSEYYYDKEIKGSYMYKNDKKIFDEKCKQEFGGKTYSLLSKKEKEALFYIMANEDLL